LRKKSIVKIGICLYLLLVFGGVSYALFEDELYIRGEITTKDMRPPEVEEPCPSELPDVYDEDELFDYLFWQSYRKEPTMPETPTEPSEPIATEPQEESKKESEEEPTESEQPTEPTEPEQSETLAEPTESESPLMPSEPSASEEPTAPEASTQEPH